MGMCYHAGKCAFIFYSVQLQYIYSLTLPAEAVSIITNYDHISLPNLLTDEMLLLKQGCACVHTCMHT